MNLHSFNSLLRSAGLSQVSSFPDDGHEALRSYLETMNKFSLDVIALSEGMDDSDILWSYGISLRPGQEGEVSGVKVKRDASGQPYKWLSVPISELVPTEPIGEKIRDPSKVKIFRRMIRNGEKLPPLHISRDMEILDGHHRFDAGSIEGLGEIDAWEQIPGPMARINLSETPPPALSHMDKHQLDWGLLHDVGSRRSLGYTRDEVIGGVPVSFRLFSNGNSMNSDPAGAVQLEVYDTRHIAHNTKSPGFIGFIRAADHPGHFAVEQSYIADQYQAKGIGRRMYEHLLGAAHTLGKESVKSDINVTESAGRVWKRLKELGYAVTGGPEAGFRIDDAADDDWSPVEPYSASPAPVKPILLAEATIPDDVFDGDHWHGVGPHVGDWHKDGDKPTKFYHGTTASFEKFGNNDTIGGGRGFDKIIGTHIAKDHEIANTFTHGGWPSYGNQAYVTPHGTTIAPNGKVLPLKVWSRGTYKVPQNGTDGRSIMVDAVRKVLDSGTPEAKSMWVDLVANQAGAGRLGDYASRRSELEDAYDAYASGRAHGNLLHGENSVLAKREQDIARGENFAKHYYPNGYEGGDYTPSSMIIGGMMGGEHAFNPTLQDVHGRLAKAYVQHLQRQGYDVLEYENTSPEETKFAIDKSSHIVFDPRRIKGYYNASPTIGDARLMMSDPADGIAAWHADSHPLTKNPDGTPKVYYHGTPDPGFDQFSKGHPSSAIQGTWVGDDPEKAGQYTVPHEGRTNLAVSDGEWGPGASGGMYPLHVKLVNPFIGAEHGDPFAQYGVDDKVAERMMMAGYDGYISPWGHTCVFKPEAMKSPWNKKPTDDPRLLMAEGLDWNNGVPAELLHPGMKIPGVTIHKQWTGSVEARKGGKVIGRVAAMESNKDATEWASFHSAVHKRYQKKGVATAMYNALDHILQEKNGGKMVPSSSMSDDALAFWAKRAPDAMANNLRLTRPDLLGKKATSRYGTGTIDIVGDNGVSIKHDHNNMTSNVSRNELATQGLIDLAEVMLAEHVAPTEGQPVAHMVLGGSGSGKSYHARSISQSSGATLIDADDVKKTIPGYESMSPDALHQAGGEKTDDLIRSSIAKREGVVIPMTGANRWRLEDTLGDLKDAGYHITGHFVHAPFEKAVSRIWDRVTQGGHDVPAWVVEDTHERAFDNLKGAARGGLLDSIRWIDNTEDIKLSDGTSSTGKSETDIAPLSQEQDVMDRWLKLTNDGLSDLGIEPDDSGLVTLYHGTSKANARSIMGGKFRPSTFFAADEKVAKRYSQMSHRQPAVVASRVHPSEVLYNGGGVFVNQSNEIPYRPILKEGLDLAESGVAEWHRDSHPLTKNEDGTPKTFYHGARKSGFDQFDLKPSTRWEQGSYDDSPSPRDVTPSAHFFTDDPDAASAYAESIGSDNPGVYPVNLHMKNPLDLRGNTFGPNSLEFMDDLHGKLGIHDWDYEHGLNEKNAWQWLDDPASAQRIKDAGYDGVIFDEDNAGTGTYSTHAVFEPNQVKSALAKYVTDDPRIHLSDYFDGEFYDRLVDMREQMAHEFMANPTAPQSWRTIPAARLHKVWGDYMKHGFVRDEKGLDDMAHTMITNALKLQVNTEAAGHAEGYGGMREWLEDAGYDVPEDDSPEYEQLDSHHYDHIIDGGTGAMKISDYAIGPIISDAAELHHATKPEHKITVMDRMLNRVHPRGDIAGLFVEGGSDTLDKISGKGVHSYTNDNLYYDESGKQSFVREKSLFKDTVKPYSQAFGSDGLKLNEDGITYQHEVDPYDDDDDSPFLGLSGAVHHTIYARHNGKTIGHARMVDLRKADMSQLADQNEENYNYLYDDDDAGGLKFALDNPPPVHVYSMGLDHKHRGKGIGTEMMHRLAQVADGDVDRDPRGMTPEGSRTYTSGLRAYHDRKRVELDEYVELVDPVKPQGVGGLKPDESTPGDTNGMGSVNKDSMRRPAAGPATGGATPLKKSKKVKHMKFIGLP